MEEILYELREHSSGLNAGRWDYLFSTIKTLRRRKDLVLPDRQQLTMTVPFMRVNEAAIAKVREDKLRESGDGFDGTWVAHPDLVPLAREIFERALGGKANQRERLRPEVSVTAAQLVDTRIPGGSVTEAGFRNNVNVGLQYLNSWLTGNGAAAIFNLMEDVATAEISRSQLWQWIRNGAKLSDGRAVTQELYEAVKAEELAKLGGAGVGRMREAIEILDGLVENEEYTEFLTLPAYPHLE